MATAQEQEMLRRQQQQAATAQQPPRVATPPPPSGPPRSVTGPPVAQPAPNPNFDLSGFQDFYDQFNQQFPQGQGGSSGSSGSFSFSSGGGGGGAGGNYPADIASSQSELMRLDPRYQAAFDELSNEARGMQGRLVDLDEQTLADLEQATAAQRAASGRVYTDKRDEMLTRLYGGGMNQSTVGLDEGGRLLGDQAMVEAGIEGDAANRRLGMRSQLTADSRELLALRGQFAGQQSDAALQELGINVNQLESGRDRRASMWETETSANATVSAASAGAAGQVAAARIGADADRFRSVAGLWGDQQRLREDGRQFDAGHELDRDRFDADSGFRRDELDLDRLRSDRDYDIGKRNVSVQRYGITSENQRHSDALSFDRDRYAGDSAFRDRSFDEDTRRWGWDYNMDRQRLDLDRQALANHAYQYNNQQRRDRQNQYLAIAGSLVGAFASDERLKTNVVPIEDPAAKLEAIRGVQWDWKAGLEPSAGVIAQEVERVLPNAVFEIRGVKVVDYKHVVALLIESQKELIARVKELEAKVA